MKQSTPEASKSSSLVPCDDISVLTAKQMPVSNNRKRNTANRNNARTSNARNMRNATAADVYAIADKLRLSQGLWLMKQRRDPSIFKNTKSCPLHKLKSLPTSGSELPFKSLTQGIRRYGAQSINCYDEAMAGAFSLRRRQKTTPGDIASILIPEFRKPISLTDCADIKARVVYDQRVARELLAKRFGEKRVPKKTFYLQENPCEPCKKGFYKIFWMLSPGNDFHWSRALPDGSWVHKQGWALKNIQKVDAAGKMICNPATANWNYGNHLDYSKPCGFGCAHNKWSRSSLVDIYQDPDRYNAKGVSLSNSTPIPRG